MHPDSAVESPLANLHGDLQPVGIHRARHGMDVDARPLRGLAQRLSPRQQVLVHPQRTARRQLLDRVGLRLALPQNPAGCNLASPNTGSYSKVLCFADFTGFTNANSNTTYCPNGTGQQMQLSIADSPDELEFCVKYTGSNVVPHAIPTYYNPGNNGYNSEAYLGNNGFYTGISGNPALYQTPNGAYTVVTFTNIQVLNAVGEAATGWNLVTGDAESTDTDEWVNFTTNLSWSILPNSTSSLYGNSCYDSNDTGGSGLFHWTGALPPTTAAVGNLTAGSGPPSATNATTLPTPVAANNNRPASRRSCASRTSS